MYSKEYQDQKQMQDSQHFNERKVVLPLSVESFTESNMEPNLARIGHVYLKQG